MDNFSEQPDPKSIEQRNPITITMLFYVVTAAAILASCYQYLDVKNDGSKLEILGASAIGAVFGLLLGAIVLFRRSSHAWLAPLLGIAIGAAAGPLLRIQLIHFGKLIGISFFGAWFLVVLMVLSARLDRSRSASN